jgi:hypothetical protein
MQCFFPLQTTLVHSARPCIKILNPKQQSIEAHLTRVSPCYEGLQITLSFKMTSFNKQLTLKLSFPNRPPVCLASSQPAQGPGPNNKEKS